MPTHIMLTRGSKAAGWIGPAFASDQQKTGRKRKTKREEYARDREAQSYTRELYMFMYIIDIVVRTTYHVPRVHVPRTTTYEPGRGTAVFSFVCVGDDLDERAGAQSRRVPRGAEHLSVLCSMMCACYATRRRGTKQGQGFSDGPPRPGPRPGADSHTLPHGASMDTSVTRVSYRITSITSTYVRVAVRGDVRRQSAGV